MPPARMAIERPLGALRQLPGEARMLFFIALHSSNLCSSLAWLNPQGVPTDRGAVSDTDTGLTLDQKKRSGPVPGAGL